MFVRHLRPCRTRPAGRALARMLVRVHGRLLYPLLVLGDGSSDLALVTSPTLIGALGKMHAFLVIDVMGRA